MSRPKEFQTLRILLTGAAGFVGGETAARLLARGHEVLAVVHRNREVRGNDGTLLPEGGRLTLVEGDIGAERLGLKQDALGPVDLILHAAAATDFTLAEEVYARINVGGTRHALGLAGALGCPLLHVGTAYVSGTREGPILEKELDCGQAFTNGYEASKAAAERLVRGAGARAAVARPSIVMGDAVTGAMRVYGSIPNLFKVMAHGLIPAMPAAPHATLDVVPVTFVAQALATLAESMGEAVGEAFHIVAAEPLPVHAMREAMCEREGLACPEFIPPDSWRPERLPPRARRAFEAVASVYAGYLSRDPRFDDRQFRALTGLQAPPADLPYIRRMIDRALAVGYLRPSRALRPAPPSTPPAA